MEKLQIFIEIMKYGAWVALVIGFIQTLASFWYGMNYEGSFEQKLHQVQGYQVDYPRMTRRGIRLFFIGLIVLLGIYFGNYGGLG